MYPETPYGGHFRNYRVYGPLIAMDIISSSRNVGEGGQARRILPLLFVDKIVLLSSSISLGQFAEAEAPGMKISASKSETMVHSQKRVDCPLRFRGRPKRRGGVTLWSPTCLGKWRWDRSV